MKLASGFQPGSRNLKRKTLWVISCFRSSFFSKVHWSLWWWQTRIILKIFWNETRVEVLQQPYRLNVCICIFLEASNKISFLYSFKEMFKCKANLFHFFPFTYHKQSTGSRKETTCLFSRRHSNEEKKWTVGFPSGQIYFEELNGTLFSEDGCHQFFVVHFSSK